MPLVVRFCSSSSFHCANGGLRPCRHCARKCFDYGRCVRCFVKLSLPDKEQCVLVIRDGFGAVRRRFCRVPRPWNGVEWRREKEFTCRIDLNGVVLEAVRVVCVGQFIPNSWDRIVRDGLGALRGFVSRKDSVLAQ